jgi:peptidoglycan hydrolase-like protein with peptidoglycan-binding domain
MKTRTAMKTWMTALALTAAGTMLATSGFAQTGAGSPPASTGTDIKSGTTPAASPGYSPSTSGSTTGSTGSDMKPGTMGADMKSGAMKNGSSERGARGVRNLEQVKAVQQALQDKGHQTGDIDGRMGPKTRAALRAFQQKEGLKSTGRADAETMAKLGVEAKTSAMHSSSSSPAASPRGVSPSDAGVTPSDAGVAKDAKSGAKQSK